MSNNIKVRRQANVQPNRQLGDLYQAAANKQVVCR